MVGLVLVLGAVLGGPGVTAQAALEQLAEREGLSLIACDLAAEPLYTGEVGELYATLDAVAAECHLETAVYRGIVLARPDPGGTLLQRLQETLTPRERELLLRSDGDSDTLPPLWWELPVRCAEDIVRGDQSEEAYARAYETAVWMAASTMCTVYGWADATASRRVALRITPIEELPQLRTKGSGFETATGWDVLLAAVPDGDATPWYGLLPGIHQLRHGPNGELFEHSAIPVYDTPTGSRNRAPRMDLPHPVPHAGVPVAATFAGALAELRDVLSGSGPERLSGAAEHGHPCVAALRNAWPDDVAQVVAKLDGRLGDPQRPGPGDRVAAALPLALWASAAVTDAERDVLRWTTQTALWAQLPAADAERLHARAARLADLSPAGQGLIRRALAPERGQEAACLLRALPRYGDVVSLWLIPRDEGRRQGYDLASRLWTERIGSFAYTGIRYPAPVSDETLPWGDENR